MEKTTVLARIRITVSFNEETHFWLDNYFPDAWFSQDNGNAFLREFGYGWWNKIEPIITDDIKHFFYHARLSPD